MAIIIGKIEKIIDGKFFVKDKDGKVRELKVGDFIYENDRVYGDLANDFLAQLDIKFYHTDFVVLNDGRVIEIDSSLLQTIYGKEEFSFFRETQSSKFEKYSSSQEQASDLRDKNFIEDNDKKDKTSDKPLAITRIFNEVEKYTKLQNIYQKELGETPENPFDETSFKSFHTANYERVSTDKPSSKTSLDTRVHSDGPIDYEIIEDEESNFIPKTDFEVPAKMMINDAEIYEQDGKIYFTITLDKSLKDSVVFTYKTSSGTATENIDYIGETNEFIISSGQTIVQIPIDIIDDYLAENSEYFNIEIVDVKGNINLKDSILNAKGTILDNPPAFNKALNSNIDSEFGNYGTEDTVFVIITGDKTVNEGEISIYKIELIDQNENPVIVKKDTEVIIEYKNITTQDNDTQYKDGDKISIIIPVGSSSIFFEVKTIDNFYADNEEQFKLLLEYVNSDEFENIVLGDLLGDNKDISTTIFDNSSLNPNESSKVELDQEDVILRIVACDENKEPIVIDGKYVFENRTQEGREAHYVVLAFRPETTEFTSEDKIGLQGGTVTISTKDGTAVSVGFQKDAQLDYEAQTNKLVIVGESFTILTLDDYLADNEESFFISIDKNSYLHPNDEMLYENIVISEEIVTTIIEDNSSSNPNESAKVEPDQEEIILRVVACDEDGKIIIKKDGEIKYITFYDLENKDYQDYSFVYENQVPEGNISKYIVLVFKPFSTQFTLSDLLENEYQVGSVNIITEDDSAKSDGTRFDATLDYDNQKKEAINIGEVFHIETFDDDLADSQELFKVYVEEGSYLHPESGFIYESVKTYSMAVETKIYDNSTDMQGNPKNPNQPDEHTTEIDKEIVVLKLFAKSIAPDGTVTYKESNHSDELPGNCRPKYIVLAFTKNDYEAYIANNKPVLTPSDVEDVLNTLKHLGEVNVSFTSGNGATGGIYKDGNGNAIPYPIYKSDGSGSGKGGIENDPDYDATPQTVQVGVEFQTTVFKDYTEDLDEFFTVKIDEYSYKKDSRGSFESVEIDYSSVKTEIKERIFAKIEAVEIDNNGNIVFIDSTEIDKDGNPIKIPKVLTHQIAFEGSPLKYIITFVDEYGNTITLKENPTITLEYKSIETNDKKPATLEDINENDKKDFIQKTSVEIDINDSKFIQDTFYTLNIETIRDIYVEGSEFFEITLKNIFYHGSDYSIVPHSSNYDPEALPTFEDLTKVEGEIKDNLLANTNEDNTVYAIITGTQTIIEGQTSTDYKVELLYKDGTPVNVTANTVVKILYSTNNHSLKADLIEDIEIFKDITSISGNEITVTIPANTSSTTFKIETKQDFWADNDEKFDLTITTIDGYATGQATSKFEKVVFDNNYTGLSGVNTPSNKVTTTIIDDSKPTEDNTLPDPNIPSDGKVETDAAQQVILRIVAVDKDGNLIMDGDKYTFVNDVAEGSSSKYMVLAFKPNTTEFKVEDKVNIQGGKVKIYTTDGTAVTTGTKDDATLDFEKETGTREVTVGTVFDIKTLDDYLADNDETFTVNIVNNSYLHPTTPIYENVLTNSGNVETIIKDNTTTTPNQNSNIEANQENVILKLVACDNSGNPIMDGDKYTFTNIVAEGSSSKYMVLAFAPNTQEFTKSTVLDTQYQGGTVTISTADGSSVTSGNKDNAELDFEKQISTSVTVGQSFSIKTIDDYLSDNNEIFTVNIDNNSYTHPSSGAIYENVVSDPNKVTTTILDNTTSNPNENSSTEPTQESVILKIVAANQDGTLKIDTNGNYLIQSDVAEGDSAYYKVLAFKPETTLFNDSTKLAIQEGSVEIITANKDAIGVSSQTLEDGTQDYISFSNRVDLNTLITIKTLDDWKADNDEQFEIKMIDKSYNHPNSETKYENVIIDLNPVVTIIKDNTTITPNQNSSIEANQENVILKLVALDESGKIIITKDGDTTSVTLAQLQDSQYEDYSFVTNNDVKEGNNAKYMVLAFNPSTPNGDLIVKNALSQEFQGGTVTIKTSDIDAIGKETQTLEDGSQDYKSYTNKEALLGVAFEIEILDDWKADYGEKFKVEINSGTYTHPNTGAIYENVTIDSSVVETTILDNTTSNPNENSSIEPTQESVILKIVAVDKDGNPIDASGNKITDITTNYVATSSVAEGDSAYYKVFAFAPNSTNFNDSTKLSIQEGTVTVSTANVSGGAVGVTEQNEFDGTQDYQSYGKATVNVGITIFTVQTFDDYKAETDETFNVLIDANSYNHPNNNVANAVYENVLINQDSVTTTIVDNDAKKNQTVTDNNPIDGSSYGEEDTVWAIIEAVKVGETNASDSKNITSIENDTITYRVRLVDKDDKPVTVSQDTTVTVKFKGEDANVNLADLLNINGTDVLTSANEHTFDFDIVIGENTSEQTFTIQTKPDIYTENPENFDLTIQDINSTEFENLVFDRLKGGGDNKTTTTINDRDGINIPKDEDNTVYLIISGDASVNEGANSSYTIKLVDKFGQAVEVKETLNVTVQLDLIDNATGADLDITQVFYKNSQNEDKTALINNDDKKFIITIETGKSEQSFKLATIDDYLSDNDEKFKLTINKVNNQESGTTTTEFEKVVFNDYVTNHFKGNGTEAVNTITTTIKDNESKHNQDISGIGEDSNRNTYGKEDTIWAVIEATKVGGIIISYDDNRNPSYEKDGQTVTGVPPVIEGESITYRVWFKDQFGNKVALEKDTKVDIQFAGENVNVNLADFIDNGGFDNTNILTLDILVASNSEATFTIQTKLDVYNEVSEKFDLNINNIYYLDGENKTPANEFENLVYGTVKTEILDRVSDEKDPQNTVYALITGTQTIVEGKTSSNYEVKLVDKDGNLIPVTQETTVTLLYSNTRYEGLGADVNEDIKSFIGATINGDNITVTIPVGSSSKTFTIETKQDFWADNDEKFDLIISAVDGCECGGETPEFERIIFTDYHANGLSSSVEASNIVITTIIDDSKPKEDGSTLPDPNNPNDGAVEDTHQQVILKIVALDKDGKVLFADGSSIEISGLLDDNGNIIYSGDNKTFVFENSVAEGSDAHYMVLAFDPDSGNNFTTNNLVSKQAGTVWVETDDVVGSAVGVTGQTIDNGTEDYITKKVEVELGKIVTVTTLDDWKADNNEQFKLVFSETENKGYSHPKDAETVKPLYENVTLNGEVTTTIKDDTDNTPNNANDNKVETTQEQVVLKIVVANSNGEPQLDTDGITYKTTSDVNEGDNAYYVVLAFAPSTTEFTTNTVLDSQYQDGTVTVSTKEVETNTAKGVISSQNGQHLSNGDFIKQEKTTIKVGGGINGLFTVKTINDYFADNNEVFEVIIDSISYKHPNNSENSAIYENVTIDITPVQTTIKDNSNNNTNPNYPDGIDDGNNTFSAHNTESDKDIVVLKLFAKHIDKQGNVTYTDKNYADELPSWENNKDNISEYIVLAFTQSDYNSYFSGENKTLTQEQVDNIKSNLNQVGKVNINFLDTDEGKTTSGVDYSGTKQTVEVGEIFNTTVFKDDLQDLNEFFTVKIEENSYQNDNRGSYESIEIKEDTVTTGIKERIFVKIEPYETNSNNVFEGELLKYKISFVNESGGTVTKPSGDISLTLAYSGIELNPATVTDNTYYDKADFEPKYNLVINPATQLDANGSYVLEILTIRDIYVEGSESLKIEITSVDYDGTDYTIKLHNSINYPNLTDETTVTGTISDNLEENKNAENTVYAVITGATTVNEGGETTYTVKLVDKAGNLVIPTKETKVTVTYTNDTTSNTDTDKSHDDTIEVSLDTSSGLGTFTVKTIDDYYAESDESYKVEITEVTHSEFEKVIFESNYEGLNRDIVTNPSNNIVTTITDNPSEINKPDSNKGEDNSSSGHYGVEDTVYAIITGATTVNEGGESTYTVKLVDKAGNLVVPTKETKVIVTYTNDTTSDADTDKNDNQKIEVTLDSSLGLGTFTVKTTDDYYAEEPNERYKVEITDVTNTGEFENVKFDNYTNTSLPNTSNYVLTTILDNPAKSMQEDTNTGEDNSSSGKYGTEDTVYVKISGTPTVKEGENLEHTITLVDSEGVHITVPSGQSVTVTLTYSANSGDFTESDLSTIVKTVTISGGNNFATFTNTALIDTKVEDVEVYNVTISSVTQSGAFENVAIHSTEHTTTGQITDNDVRVVLIAVDEANKNLQWEELKDKLVDSSGTLKMENQTFEGGNFYYIAIAVDKNNKPMDVQKGSVTVAYETMSERGATLTNATDENPKYPTDIKTNTVNNIEELGKVFVVNVLDDYYAEGDESFTVTISGLTDAESHYKTPISIDNGHKTVTSTIIDNSAGKNISDTNTGEDNSTTTYGVEDTVYLTITGPQEVIEGDKTAEYTISLVDKDGNSVNVKNDTTIVISYTGRTVKYNNIEYSNNGQIKVTIKAGNSNQTFKLQTIDDPYKNDGETFKLTISDVENIGEFENIKFNNYTNTTISNNPSNNVITAIRDNSGLNIEEKDTDPVKIVLVALEENQTIADITNGDGKLIYTNTNTVPEGGKLYYIAVAVDGEDKVLIQNGKVKVSTTDITALGNLNLTKLDGSEDYKSFIDKEVDLGVVFEVETNDDYLVESAETFKVEIKEIVATNYETVSIDTYKDTIISTITSNAAENSTQENGYDANDTVYVVIEGNQTVTEGTSNSLIHNLRLIDKNGAEVKVPDDLTITVTLKYTSTTGTINDTDFTNTRELTLILNSDGKATITNITAKDIFVEGTEVYTLSIENVTQSSGYFENLGIGNVSGNNKSVTGTIIDESAKIVLVAVENEDTTIEGITDGDGKLIITNINSTSEGGKLYYMAVAVNSEGKVLNIQNGIVKVSTVDGTAFGGTSKIDGSEDFVILNKQDVEIGKVFSVQTIDDYKKEVDEIFTVKIDSISSNGSYTNPIIDTSKNTVTSTIKDTESSYADVDTVWAVITADKESVVEGKSVAYTVQFVDKDDNPVIVSQDTTVTVQFEGLNGNITLADLSEIIVNETDVLTSASENSGKFKITIPNTSSFATFTVTTLDDFTDEGDATNQEQFTLTITDVQDTKEFENLVWTDENKNSVTTTILDGVTFGAPSVATVYEESLFEVIEEKPKQITNQSLNLINQNNDSFGIKFKTDLTTDKTSNGKAITYNYSDSDTKITAISDEKEVFIIKLNQTGTYDFELKEPIDQVETSSLDLLFEFNITSDGTTSTNQTFTVKVVDSVPVSQNITETMKEDGEPITIRLSNEAFKDGKITINDNTIANGGTANIYENGATSVNAVGTLKNNGNGTVTFTPNANYSSTNSTNSPKFSYSVTDFDGDTSSGTVQINITPVVDGVDLSGLTASGKEFTKVSGKDSGDEYIELKIETKGLNLLPFIDNDGSEKVTQISLSGLPTGFIVYYGDENSKTETTANNIPVVNEKMPNIYIKAPEHWSGTIANLTLSTVIKDGTEEQTFEQTFDLNITAVASDITIDPKTTSGNAFSWLELKLGATMQDTDGSEKMSLELSGLSANSQFKINGTVLDNTKAIWNSDKWTISDIKYDEINKIQFTSEKDVNNVTVKAWTVEGSNQDVSAPKESSFKVDVNDIAGELVLSEGINLDFSKLDKSELKNITSIDLGAGNGKNELLNLTLADVLAIGKKEDGKINLNIFGGGTNQIDKDKVSFASNNGWKKDNNQSESGFIIYSNTENDNIKVKVESSIDII